MCSGPASFPKDTRGLWHITRTAIQPPYSGGTDRQRAGLSGAGERSAAMAGASTCRPSAQATAGRSILRLLVTAREGIVKRWQQDRSGEC